MLAATISVSKSALGMASTYGKPPPSFEQQYAKQLEVFDCSLFPVEDYSMRNAASRKDGYWPYVSRKEEPPSDLVYGEFPLPFFHRVLQRACVHAGIGADRSEATFADLGSGRRAACALGCRERPMGAMRRRRAALVVARGRGEGVGRGTS